MNEESMSWDGSQIAPTLTQKSANGAQRMPDKGNFNAVLTIRSEYEEPLLIETHSRDSRWTLKEDGICQALTTVMGTGGGNVSMITEQTVVRRLTPKEAERLQGFPDDWTQIGDWVDSRGRTRQSADGLRYKALGNSIALPFWQWLSDRICAQLRESGVEEPTMASLFDGIGGFPLVFSRSGCVPVWASEIEEFPIAVTKKHFPERETEMKGNENELSERNNAGAEPNGG